MTSQYLKLVDEFHAAFDYRQPTPTQPDITDTATNNLREDLLREELSELEDALSSGDAVAVLDALCDLQYVLSGAVLALGFAPVFDAAFAEVHRSNMSKLFQSRFDLHPDAAEYQANGTGQWIGRRADGKILKSPTYSPANLRQFVK